MASELEISIKNVIKRSKELNEFKDSGSVKEGEMERLQVAVEELRRSYEDADGENAKILREYYSYKDREKRKRLSGKEKLQLKRLMADMESRKNEIDDTCASLGAFEAKFRKYNVPKRLRMAPEQPLKPYLGRLREFMKSTWREESEKSREKEQRSLLECMAELDLSNDEDMIAFDALKNAFTDIGIQISMYLVEFFLIIMAVSDEGEEILALMLHEVKAILKCLSVEENSYSIVINMFVKTVQFFEGAMKLAGPFSDEAKGQKSKEDAKEKKAIFFLDDERKDDLLRLIFIEVLRLEVSYRSPDLPMKVINDVYYSMASHLMDNVFEEKLKRVGAEIYELNSDVQLAHDDDSSEMSFFWRVLVAGVDELWTKLDAEPGSLTRLVLL
ncbi:hypothetical protein TorRG33x02_259760 [Trema orientale]|uniref:Uncharacterized protein n=1 Tax=Trema orientale TaxID=63057 RepID=A0A2P5D774_TREOI|nr:hypothetical protein TorRG33x02_259760 [Trema orientale]